MDAAAEYPELPEQNLGRLPLAAVKADYLRLQEWLEQVLGSLRVSSRERRQVLVAADEIFANIAEHGYPPDSPDRSVDVAVGFTPDSSLLLVVFTDHGREFNPLSVDNSRTIRERVQQHIPGGLGLYLVRKFMDHLTYRREKNCNILSLYKVLHLDAGADQVPPGERRC